MKGMNKLTIIAIAHRPFIVKKAGIQLRKQKYLEMKRQREIDAIVEFTRNQLMDRYNG
jgi:hypothetical protein